MIKRKLLPSDAEQTLEQRLGAALADETASASELAVLVAEAQRAIMDAEDEAKAEGQNALDWTRSPDARAAARSRVEDAQSPIDRLQTLLPRLQARQREVAAVEEVAKWEADYLRCEAERDALATELAEAYPRLMAMLADLFARLDACHRECVRIGSSRPRYESRRLQGPELKARGLERFTRDEPSIAQNLRIPDWANSAKTVWPPPRQRDFSVLAVPHDPRFSAEWSSPEVMAAREAAARAENERMSGHYEAQTKAQEDRINREERERFAKRKG
jgi:hypothetical protein